MPIWKGKGTLATDDDIAQIAKSAGIEKALMLAWKREEAPRGPFDEKGRVTILYERHYFWNYAKAADRIAAKELANKVGGGYGTYASQYGKLERVFKINPQAALFACSWGSGQIMGANAKKIGYKSVEQMVELFAESEVNQLEGIIKYLKTNNLIDDAQRLDFVALAVGYNGVNQADSNYSGRLRNSYLAFKKLEKSTKLEVKSVAQSLKELGYTGADLKEVVMKFQTDHKLFVDGIAGTLTKKAIQMASAV